MRGKVGYVLGWISEWVLWLAFANSVDFREIIVGGIVSAVSMIAIARFHRHTHGRYNLRFAYLLQFARVPRTIATGAWIALRTTVLRSFGREILSGIVTVPFRAGGNGPASRGRRAIAITFLTLGPNSLVLGFPPGQRSFYFHTLIPEPLPSFVSKMGARLSHGGSS